jgi:hypothetical protein
VLFGMAALCVLAGFGLAFTLYGELALGLSVVLGVCAALLMARSGRWSFQPPPGWPSPPPGWHPTRDWRPDPSWPPAPPGWRYWVPRQDGDRDSRTP